MSPGLASSLCLILISILSALTGLSAVDFVTQPADVTRVYGQESIGTTITNSFEFECVVNSSAESDQTLSWIKNGEIISNGNRFRSNITHLVDSDRYVVTQNAYHTALVVKPASASTAVFDSGIYQCAVTGSNGVVVPDGRSRNAHANIYVIDSIPTINKPICQVINLTDHTPIGQLDSISVVVGNSYALTCFSTLDNQLAHLLWYKHYPNDVVESILNGTSNGFRYVTYYWIPVNKDGPSLTFICVDDVSSNSTCSIRFNIQYAPIVTIDPTEVTVTEKNDEIVLHCKQDSNPQVTEPVWYYDDNIVNGSVKFRMEAISLIILTFDSQDNGKHVITCAFANEVGTGNASATLIVDIRVTTDQPKVRELATSISPTVDDNRPC
ncbi:cell adhesion molecule 4-like [Ptychodera flava]|uniref:cell adhesion molecule 4-like n=1 Tax=Ptychodera flava TaxID=63121 RepID=UPI003969C449